VAAKKSAAKPVTNVEETPLSDAVLPAVGFVWVEPSAGLLARLLTLLGRRGILALDGVITSKDWVTALQKYLSELVELQVTGNGDEETAIAILAVAQKSAKNNTLAESDWAALVEVIER
jgi:hypothetical protein